MTAAVSAALVLFLAAALFTGAAGAVQITASEWNELDAAGINGNTSYQFYGTGIIYPKFSSSAVFTPNHDITFDFTSYQGIFSGDQAADIGYRGALFGRISNTSTAITLTFNNLTLTSVNVTTGSGSYVGGIVGFFEGKSSDESRLIFENCHIVNCSISGGKSVGGLVGGTKNAAVTAENCCVEHCDAVSIDANVGGLVGYADTSVSIINNGTVANCTVASIGKQNAGGLVGYAESASFENCSVKNTSVYANAEGVWGNAGGLAGDAKYVTKADNCTVINCVIASGSGRVGGLAGCVEKTAGNVSTCAVVNCTVAGPEVVGGLVGYAKNTVTGNPTNDVLNSAVNGSSLFGTNCDDVMGSFTGSENGTVRYYQSPYPGTTPLERSISAFWNLISWGGTDAGVSGMHTILGTYAVSGGYGVGSYIPPAAYTVTYNANDADSGTVPVDSAKYPANAEVSVPGNPGSLAKTGFVFNGWNLGNTAGELKKEGDTFIITEDTTLYANWTASVKPAYVEVSDWDALVQNASGWTDKETMRTIVLTNKTDGAYRNVTGTAGNYSGIPVTGNITIMPASAASEIKIDANGMGRIFNVSNGANLTLSGNTSAVLNLTGGRLFGSDGLCDGGAVYMAGADVTLISGAKITNSSAVIYGGGVCVAENGRFTLTGDIIGCSVGREYDDGSAGGVYVAETGIFEMNGGSISDCKAGISGGGVYVDSGTFNLTGGSITGCRITSDASLSGGGGVYVNLGSVFTMTGGSIDTCSAKYGGGIYTYGTGFMTGGSVSGNSAESGAEVMIAGDSFTVDEDAEIGDGGVVLICDLSAPPAAYYVLTCGSSFTEHVDNITLYKKTVELVPVGKGLIIPVITLEENVSLWLDQTVVENGGAQKSNFTLSPSPSYSGYGLNVSGDNLVLVELPQTYVEVSDWDALVQKASEWIKTDEMRTIVLTNETKGAYKNTTGSGNYGGIPITGNITIMPASGVSEIKIDANQKGRLFNVTSGANLTLAGNSSTVLNVTGGYVFGTGNNGGGVLVNTGGNFTLAADAKITNCSVGNTCCGGGVYNLGMFTLLHGTIDNCRGSYGGGVYIIGAFTMSGGSIINCSATQFGGGVYCEERFTMDGESSIINCSASNGGSGGGTGGGVFVKSGGTFSMDDSSIINCRAGGNGGGVSIATGGIFSMDGSNIVNCSTDRDGGGVENQGMFTLSESTIKDCYATGSFNKGGIGGGGGVMNYGVFTMASGLLDNCSTGKNGGGVCNKGSSFTMNGSALVNDAVYLASGKNITLGDGGFAAGNYGAKNITLAGDAAGWLGHTIVKDGKDNASYFTLSQAITGYALAAGTGDQENDLVLAEYKSPYVEVNDWDALVAAASGWADKEKMRTIVLTNTTEGAYKNMTGDAGDDWPGIPVTGNITIMPNSSVTASEIKIDANQKGRLFDVMSGANLTVCDNGSAALNLTGGYIYGGGACVNLTGTFTMNGGSITNSCAATGDDDGFGGAVSVVEGAFIMNSGNITGCTATQGGGVYVKSGGTFTMSGGSIKNCSAKNGGSVFLDEGTFTLYSGSIENCTAVRKGGGIMTDESECMISMYGGSIKNCSAGDGGGVWVDGNGEFTMSGGSIEGCSATEGEMSCGGGVYVYMGTFTMEGGSVEDCSADYYGSDVCVSYSGLFSMKGGSIADTVFNVGTFNISGSAAVNTAALAAFDGEEIIPFGLVIDTGLSVFTGSVSNITLYRVDDAETFEENVTIWLGQAVVKNGAGKALQFALSSACTGYALAAGTGDQANDLVLAEYKSPYVEVNDWNSLNTSVAEWTSATGMRTVVVTGNITDREADENADGIKVTGLVTVTVADGPGDEYCIDGSSLGRIFEVADGGNLTLVGNGSRVLNVTGGYMSDSGKYGGGIYVDDGGNLTIAADAKITNCSATSSAGGIYVGDGNLTLAESAMIVNCSASESGGGVFVDGGMFTMTSGNISGCSATSGSGVYVFEGTFIMTDSSIDGCNATGYGGGVLVDQGIFTMDGGSMRNCTAAKCGGAVFGGSVTVSDGIIIDNKAPVGAGICAFNLFLGGTAVVSENNDAAVISADDEFCSITSDESFTGNVGNITLYLADGDLNFELNASAWVDQTVVLGGAGKEGQFILSPLHLGYMLETSGSDLILNLTEYAITYELNGGTNAEANPESYNITSVVTLQPASRGGYTFEHWYNSSAFTPANVTTGITEGSTGDKTFYANYTANVTEVTFNNESVPHEKQFTYDAAAVAEPGIKAGHTFLGWFDASGVQVFTDTGALNTSASGYVNATDKWGYDGSELILWANYSVNTCNVTFNPENCTDAWNVSVAYNTTVSEPSPAPTKPGYTFNGWNVSSASGSAFDFSTLITEDIQLYANYSIVEYPITYVLDGGVNGANPDTYNITSEITFANARKTGYTFEHWYNSLVFTQKNETTGIEAGSTGDKIIYANYTANVTAVTFNNESVPHEKQFTYDQTAEAEPGIKAGSSFLGWFDASGVQVFTDTGALNTSASGYVNATDKWGYEGAELTLWANYSVNYCNVTFHPENGTAAWNVTVQSGTSISAPSPAPTKPGYTFQGWNKSSPAGEPFVFDTVAVTEDIQLFANYTANVTMVTFNNESVQHQKEFTYDAAAIAELGIKAGSSFLGWFDAAGVQVFTDTGSLNTSAVLYVNATDKWGYDGAELSLWANYSVNYCNVTFNPLNGTAAWNESVAYGTSVQKPSPDPVKTGYTFQGWNKSSAAGEPFDFSTPITEDTELFANYSIVEYSITYVLNGGENGANPEMYNITSAVVLADASKTGYTFENWYNSSAFTPANVTTGITAGSTGDKTFYANYTANVTVLNLTGADGASFAERIETFGVFNETPVTPLPEKSEHVFAGWNVSDNSGVQLINATGYLQKVSGYTNTTTGAWENSTLETGAELKLDAVWTAIPKYNITNTSVENGTITADKAKAAEGETVNVTAAANTGYHFSDWNVTNTSGGQIPVAGNAFTMPAEDVNAGALFAANVTTVTFYNVSDVIDSKLNTYKEATNVTSAPSRDGFVFNGWNVSSADGTPFDSASYNASGIWMYTGAETTLNVYANWTEIPTYQITNVTVNGNVTANQTSAYAGDIIHVEAAADTGYHFVSWNVTNSTGGQIDVDESGNFEMPAENVNAGAEFAVNVYAVNFSMMDHGDQVENQSVAHGSTVEEPAAPSEELWTFNGWYSDLQLTSKYNFSTPVTANVDLYANWTAVPTYQITNVTVNGNVTANQTTAYAGEIIHVDAAADTGYHFVSWNVTKASGGQINVDASGNFVMPAENVNAGAVFAANTYTIVFDGNGKTGGHMADQQMTYDVADYLTENGYTRTYYAFLGWNATGAYGTAVDYADGELVENLTAVDGGIVTLYAVWSYIPPQPSSKPDGASVWLTPTPTPVPTAAPAGDTGANATKTPSAGPVNSTTTPASPLPILGLIAGLAGAAAVVLRRK